MSIPYFPVGSKIETTKIYKKISGFYHKGIVMSCDELYVDIITDKDSLLSIRTCHVQEST